MTTRSSRMRFGCVTTMVLALVAIGDPASADETADSRAGRIILEAHTELPKPPDFYTANARSTATLKKDHIEQTVELKIRIVQGEADTVSLDLNGDGQITNVTSDQIKSWSVRKQGTDRFLDIHPISDAEEIAAIVSIESAKFTLPTNVSLTHLGPGKAVGFDSLLRLVPTSGIESTVSQIEGFAPLGKLQRADQFQTSTGGRINLKLSRDGAAIGPVELTDTYLTGTLHPDGKSISFQLRGTAIVTEEDAEITVLSGDAAITEIPDGDNYRLQLSGQGAPVYKLVFDSVGAFPVDINFVARLSVFQSNGRSVDFTVAGGAVVPIQIDGMDADVQFERDPTTVVPSRQDDQWVGFLPANGRARLQWKSATKESEGKLFFSTNSIVNANLGVGLLKQAHQINYRVLQGEIESLDLQLSGPGEVLDVQGPNIVSWKVTGNGDERRLQASLSQPISTTSQITIKSQTPLGAFPVRVEGLRVSPEGSIRHSGHLRLSNTGSVRLEPTGTTGLTQLAPEQFPGDAVEARQTFVYRFPSTEYELTIVADRIQPEISVAQLIRYELAETDRTIRAAIELDIREAPIRDWGFDVPADYSVVAVTGANVADYIVGTEVTNGRRNLKVIFDKDIGGRQLVRLQLEKNEAVTAGDWLLPKIDYPGAKAVRGDIGILGAAGFRLSVQETSLLVEKPLSYFPEPSPDLQQAFRIREPGWTATMSVERLERSVQADVFHLYSLSQETIYGSALVNYFVTGAPVSEWRIIVPSSLGNIMVDGKDVRTWRVEDNTLIVSLHQPVMGAYTLLVTFEQKADTTNGSFQVGQVEPLDVSGERGFIQVVSPKQVELTTQSASADLLKLEAIELPAEFRLLSTAPALGTWQYTQRPFNLNLQVKWFEPGTTVPQVVEFSEANSRVSQDGELVTDVIYYVKSRDQRSLKVNLPPPPVRLWDVSVNGQPVTARQTDEATLIPLPGSVDPNAPVEVRLRLGKPTVSGSKPQLALPVVHIPVLKTQWNVQGDEGRVLVPSRGTVAPTTPVLRPTGFHWLASRGLGPTIVIALLAVSAVWLTRLEDAWRPLSLVLALGSVAICFFAGLTAYSQMGNPGPLQLSLPILSAGELVELQVMNTPLWQVNFSWTGIVLCALGVSLIVYSMLIRTSYQLPQNEDDAASPAVNNDQDVDGYRLPIRAAGAFLIGVGVLYHRDGAPTFFTLLAAAILLFLVLPIGSAALRQLQASFRESMDRRKKNSESESSAEKSNRGDEPGTGSAVMTTLLLASILWLGQTDQVMADGVSPYQAADAISQNWNITNADRRLSASVSATLSGIPGDQFLLLRSPAVLTKFEGAGLRLSKVKLPDAALAYVVSIPSNSEAESTPDATEEATDDSKELRQYQLTFDYQLESVRPSQGIPVLTGQASVRQVSVHYDKPGWIVTSSNAVRVESNATEAATEAQVLLGLGKATIYLKPKARDVASEQTQFFVEASNLYVPGPGVIDGRHQLAIRVAQGQVAELDVQIPEGLTVSSVNGPVGSWQFDADAGRLQMQLEPIQSDSFVLYVETQRGLQTLPAETTIGPLSVSKADGQVGMVAIAFGPDAQLEQIVPTSMSAVNLGDFDASLIPQKATLHRVYRYGADGGQLDLRVAPVEPEVRVVSKQVISLGDERVVVGINFTTEITRAGLFQLNFPLPGGLEVESLSGDALDHWSELTVDGQRSIILHLKGKTIGTQRFALTMSGQAPTSLESWNIPRFQITRANRQTGELVVRPTTGIRLRTLSRQNVSETDPRSLGGDGKGALAFRLLQSDWGLQLGIEKLEPWVTGNVLQEITMREGQTRTSIMTNFKVQNASIRSLQVILPISDTVEIRTLRATGDTVSDLVRTAPDSNIWQVNFKRRVIGNVDFRIEYERRGDRPNDTETMAPIEFPQARQLSYYFGVRVGGRLEVQPEGEIAAGWQQVGWNTVPAALRETGNRAAPTLVLRASAPNGPVSVRAVRHSVADALKLRVTRGTLTTVLSPSGDQLTSVDVTMEVIQRSSLTIDLPAGGELFSIFVNGESVNSIRKGGTQNTWQFYILPGMDDRTATVRFVYSVKGSRLRNLALVSPQLNVPLEDIEWNVVAPEGFELASHDGNLELVRRRNAKSYDRESYLMKVSGKRQQQAQQATQLLLQANQLLQAGEQNKAEWAFSNVANQYALDAASNEDARVQLENLQTQQAIVGLNTRRQRLYLDNEAKNVAAFDNKQLRDAAAVNPILQNDQINFRPQQLSQLLRGNTTEDNAVLQQIAGRIVQHQRTTEPAPQAIVISLPEEGSTYSFTRSVQVAEDTPLELDLKFRSQLSTRVGRIAAVLVTLVAISAALVYVAPRTQDTNQDTNQD